MSRLNGRIAIVTGGCSGIGRATVELFAAEGAKVYAADIARPPQGFEQEAVHFASLDVASAAGWQALTEDVATRHGRIDVLVNNAGVGGSMAALADENLESWHQVLTVNLTGTFLGMRAVIPRMLTQGAGSIINLSSIWGNAAVAFGAAYHASKGGVRQLTKHAAVAYGLKGIRINSVHPGVVATPPVLQAQSAGVTQTILGGSAMERMAQPIEIARSILFLASDESSFMTGAELVVDGGYLAKGS
jgi:NAD(P)-dependent dehydrogenase (short-subunit alcohol dehydrogenase family)